VIVEVVLGESKYMNDITVFHLGLLDGFMFAMRYPLSDARVEIAVASLTNCNSAPKFPDVAPKAAGILTIRNTKFEVALGVMEIDKSETSENEVEVTDWLVLELT